MKKKLQNRTETKFNFTSYYEIRASHPWPLFKTFINQISIQFCFSHSSIIVKYKFNNFPHLIMKTRFFPKSLERIKFEQTTKAFTAFVRATHLFNESRTLKFCCKMLYRKLLKRNIEYRKNQKQETQSSWRKENEKSQKAKIPLDFLKKRENFSNNISQKLKNK